MVVTKFNGKLSNFTKEYPTAAAIALGLGLYPVNLVIETIAQSTLSVAGINPVNMKSLIYNSWQNITHFHQRSLSFIIRSPLMPIGEQLFYGEIIQNHILDKQVTKLLNRFAPGYAHLPKTTTGKILRVAASSLLNASLVFLDQLDLRPGRCYQSAGFAFASAINIFAGACLSGGAREITGSNLPGIAFLWIQNI